MSSAPFFSIAPADTAVVYDCNSFSPSAIIMRLAPVTACVSRSLYTPNAVLAAVTAKPNSLALPPPNIRAVPATCPPCATPCMTVFCTLAVASSAAPAIPNPLAPPCIALATPIAPDMSWLPSVLAADPSLFIAELVALVAVSESS